MLGELPFDDLAVWDEVQHALHEGAKVPKNPHHLRLGSRRGVRRRDTFGKVDIGLCAGEVVDGLVGDGVGDNVSLLADPSDHAVAVEQGQHLRVVRHVFALEHDAVRSLACIGLAEFLADFGEEGASRGGLDAVGGEDDVGFDLVAVAIVGFHRENGLGREGVDVHQRCAEFEGDGGLFETGIVYAAGQRGSVTGTVWVAVFLLNVGHVHVGQLLVGAALSYTCFFDVGGLGVDVLPAS